MDTGSFNVISLCSGVGALDLATRMAVPSARTIAYCEIEAYLCGVLAARMDDGSFDDCPLWSDLATFDGKPWRGVVDCVAAGYPCQCYSKAGKLGGAGDERYLWPHVRRVVEECRPGHVFLENVANHLKRGFDVVRQDLLDLGYEVAAGVFSAAEVGAPFEGERLFALAAAKHARVEGLVQGGDPRPAGPWGWRGQEDLQAIAAAPLQPGDRFPQPVLRRVDAGSTKWLDSLRALGNTVVPAVAAFAWRHLAAELASTIDSRRHAV